MKISDYQRYTRNKKKITTEAKSSKSSKCIFNDIYDKYIRISDHIDNPVIKDINKIIANMKNFEIEAPHRLLYNSSEELRIPLYKINLKNIKRISELKSTKLFKISNTYCKRFKFSRIGRNI